MAPKTAAIAASLAVALPAQAGRFESPHEASFFEERTFVDCKAELYKALDADTLRRVEWRSPHRRAHALIGPAFLELQAAERQRLASSMNCFLVGGRVDTCVNFELYHWQTGQHVGRVRNCRYLDGPGR